MEVQQVEDCKNKFIKTDGAITVNRQKIQVSFYSMNDTWLQENIVRDQPVYKKLSMMSVYMFPKNTHFF